MNSEEASEFITQLMNGELLDNQVTRDKLKELEQQGFIRYTYDCKKHAICIEVIPKWPDKMTVTFN